MSLAAEPGASAPPILTIEEYEAASAELFRPPREKRFGRVSLGEIARRAVLPPDFVIDDWMVAREQSFLAGESQSGKSFLAMHAAMSIATGRDVLGMKTKQGLVIYQAGESGLGVTGLRVPAWLQHYGQDIDPEGIPIEFLPARVNLFSENGNAGEFHQAIEAIRQEWADRFPLRLVIIDTMSKAMSGANENDGRDVGRVLEHCERISRDTGAHVCIVHHLPKNGVGMRGHGSLKGDTDSVVMVKLGDNKVRSVIFDKVKDGEAGGKLHFELMQVKLGQRDDGKPITSCVVLPVGEKDAAKKAEAARGFLLRPNEEVIFRALMNALKKRGRLATAEMITQGVPEGAEVVENSDWREEYRSIAPPDGEGAPPSTDAIKKHMQRHFPALARYEVVGWRNPWMWWTGRPVRNFPETQRRDKAGTDAGQCPDNSGTGDDTGGL